MSNSKGLRPPRLARSFAALAASLLALHAAASWAEPVAAPTDPVDGVLVPEAEPSASPARTLLVVPRTAVATVSVPLRGGLTLYERYNVRERLEDLFFNDARTFGVYPIVGVETRLPPLLGARLVHKDLFGSGAGLRVAADYGGEAHYRLQGGLSSPVLAGGLLRGRLLGGWERQPHAPFYGIGDQDLVSPAAAAVGMPGRSPMAVASKFSQEIVHTELAAELDPAGPLFAAVSAAYFQRVFHNTSPSDPSAIPTETDVLFDTTTLTGWSQGTRVAYGEAQLGWNSLATANAFVPDVAPSTGTKVVVFAGLARDVGGAPVAYTRYGVSGLRYFDLFNGDRVLILRGRLEGVAGAADRIPFTDLPRLGGPVLLRGFDRDRFRDRVSVLGSVEYRYPIWQQLAGFLFVDGGRVLPSLADAGGTALAPQHLRGSAGGGLELMTGDKFRMRGQVAGSSEGFFFQFAMEPLYRLPTHNYRI